MGKKSRKRRRKTPVRKSPSPKVRDIEELDLNKLRATLDEAQKTLLSDRGHEQLTAAVETLAFITQELMSADVTIARLKKLIFGSSSEKTSDVLGSDSDDADSDDADADSGEEEKKKKKGHGRRAASEYTGAEKVDVPHEGLKHKDLCPDCQKGKVYKMIEPAKLVRIRGVSPLDAKVFRLERLRCNLCGEIFTAKAPPGLGEKKYDESAAAIIILLKYGVGMPFNRLQRLGRDLGIPLPASTQWDLVLAASKHFRSVWTELINQAADGDVVYIDDTNAKVLELNEEIRKDLATDPDARTGVFTSGVVSTTGKHKIVIFFTGRRHAGENLRKVLELRETSEKPIVMFDATSRNSVGEFDAIVANCLVHGRRNFVNVTESFPEEVAYVLKQLRGVYATDAKAREDELSPKERLALHQKHSDPLMTELKTWLKEQFEQRLVEPNSPLGKAIKYMNKHWVKLTRFLHVEGAPLDNNLCERVLKRVILHRKNSLHFKSVRGAKVGDIFMSLIHTAEFCDANPFEYLIAIQKHSEAATTAPALWMPWNYLAALEKIAGAEDIIEAE